MKTKIKGMIFNILVFGSLFFVGCVLTFVCCTEKHVYAAEVDDTDNNANLSLNLGGLSIEYNDEAENSGEGELPATIKMLLILTVITLAPSILVMVTSFTRIIVVLHFLRSAIGTQTTPPNQVMIGLALFLTLFIMSPVITKINDQAIVPYQQGTLTSKEAFDAGVKPVREFMINEVLDDDLRLFVDMAGIEEINSEEDLPTYVLVPAFIISELKQAFIIGFLIYIPFIIIDMVVASTLMSMGMMMLPPTTISMPFKIVLFIMADGWNLIVGEVVKTFLE